MRPALGPLAIVAAAMAIVAVGGTAHAKTFPWCMIIQDQDDGWACGFETFEQCRLEARSGNTGFCAPNPAYQAQMPAPKSKHRRPRSR